MLVKTSSKFILAIVRGVKFLREFKSQNLKTRFAISFVFNNCTAATTTATSTTYLQVVKVQLVFKTTLVWKESVAKTKHYIGPHDDLVPFIIESHWARAWCEEDGAKLYHHHDSVIAIAPRKLCKGQDCLLEFLSQENESQRAWQKKGSYWVWDDCLKHIIDAQGSHSLYLLGTSCVQIKESIILLPTIINGMNLNI